MSIAEKQKQEKDLIYVTTRSSKGINPLSLWRGAIKPDTEVSEIEICIYT